MQRILYFIFIALTSLSSQAQWDILPDRMWADSTHAPFQYGVASGDPLPNAVIIWTRIEATGSPTVYWKVANDIDMNEVVQSGNINTSEATDWTVKIDVTGLNPYTTYYYQFEDEAGNVSAIGRTKTAPTNDTNTDSLKVAIASCSSIFSGYFNAYARMAERNDVDLVVHLGDYIYDFVDEDEQVRVPEPYPIDPQTKAEFRQRHRYYLLDPDLRAVRQQHPFFALWDNHDIFKNNETDLIGSIEAFYEYLPIRQPDMNEPKRIYRSLKYGNLLDIMVVDIELWRNQDTIAGTGENSLLGTAQYEWLINELANSTARWRILGNQKLFSNWAIDHLSIPLPFGDGVVADPNSWDGFPAERARLLTFLRENEIDNNIVISGDIHLSVAADLAINPKDSLEYNPETGEGAIGVEFVSSSITRGNVDEALGISPNPGAFDFLIDLSLEGNPHHEYLEVFQHGYGLLHLNQDSTIAHFNYSDKYEVVETDTTWQELVVRAGENHWVSGPLMFVEEPEPDSTSLNAIVSQFEMTNIQPNPTSQKSTFFLTVPTAQNVTIDVLDIRGQKMQAIQHLKQGQLSPNIPHSIDILTSNLANGLYLVVINGEGFSTFQKLVVVGK